MRYVLEASVALKWVLPEPLADRAQQLRDDFQKHVHELLAPDLFAVETAHALTRAERQKIIPVGHAAGFLANILSTCPLLHPYLPLLTRATDISSQLRVGVHDCVYVALAEREKCELVTADDRLVKNLQPLFAFITPLSALPGVVPPTSGS
jgi:predicted nucleic acid-binding protein